MKTTTHSPSGPLPPPPTATPRVLFQPVGKVETVKELLSASGWNVAPTAENYLPSQLPQLAGSELSLFAPRDGSNHLPTPLNGFIYREGRWVMANESDLVRYLVIHQQRLRVSGVIVVASNLVSLDNAPSKRYMLGVDTEAREIRLFEYQAAIRAPTVFIPPRVHILVKQPA